MASRTSPPVSVSATTTGGNPAKTNTATRRTARGNRRERVVLKTTRRPGPTVDVVHDEKDNASSISGFKNSHQVRFFVREPKGRGWFAKIIGQQLNLFFFRSRRVEHKHLFVEPERAF